MEWIKDRNGSAEFASRGKGSVVIERTIRLKVGRASV